MFSPFPCFVSPLGDSHRPTSVSVFYSKAFSENDMKSFEFKSLQETLDEIRATVDSSNLRWVRKYNSTPAESTKYPLSRLYWKWSAPKNLRSGWFFGFEEKKVTVGHTQKTRQWTFIFLSTSILSSHLVFFQVLKCDTTSSILQCHILKVLRQVWALIRRTMPRNEAEVTGVKKLGGQGISAVWWAQQNVRKGLPTGIALSWGSVALLDPTSWFLSGWTKRIFW